MAELKQKEPALLFFYEIMPGDLAKYKTQSNIAQSGGGARDVRPRPGEGFGRVLRPMFPRKTSRNGVFEGTIHWFDNDENVVTEDIKLWTIYEAREGEVRIGTFYRIGGWAVAEDEYQKSLANGNKWFYALIMDTDNVTWAYVMKEEELDQWSSEVRDYVRKRINLTRKGKKPPHVNGSLNFVTGEEFP